MKLLPNSTYPLSYSFAKKRTQISFAEDWNDIIEIGGNKTMAFGFLITIAKVILRAVVGEVFGAEKALGAGSGNEKLDIAVSGVSELLGGKFGLEKVANAIDEIVDLVNAVVEAFNALGMLDDEPGLDVDYNRLIPAVKSVFSALAALADALS
jgi:hypothetical protein